MSVQLYYHHLVDIEGKRIYPAEIKVEEGKIVEVQETNLPCTDYVLPGFIDAHVHIESSMLLPVEFARAAVQFGTLATISDPHEIANVCGINGVLYMLDNAAQTPFKFHFGAPSCVPATQFETAGATIGPKEVNELLCRPDIYYLSEMMNYPGVLMQDEEVMQKIDFAKKAGKPIDGHAPGLMGEDALRYISAGITTDHECFTIEEALGKLKAGMKILIREGSAARNFDALIDLLHEYENEIMFCCDDKHPDELVLHHINQHVIRAVARGIDVFKVLKAACINPVKHYKMRSGLLNPGDPADFIVVKDLKNFEVVQTVIDGQAVFNQGKVQMPSITYHPINQFGITSFDTETLQVHAKEDLHQIHVIQALDGQLITNDLLLPPKVNEGLIISDTENDILKMVVVNRYHEAPTAKAFVKNFQLKKGAIASTVAHDSHNIIAVGVEDQYLAKAINLLVKHQGGIAVCSDEQDLILPLPVAGLMSLQTADEVARAYTLLHEAACQLGSTLRAPFMTLSFMALLVIPELKLSDKGLFSSKIFNFTPLQFEQH